MSNSAEEQNPPAADVEATPVEEDVKSKRVTLADLSAKGTALYAQKKYEEASELFSEASNLQAEINGETAPENSEILFHYGRSLFQVGQSKSNVLGGPGAVEKQAVGANGKPKAKASKSAEKPAEAGGSADVAQKPEASANGKAEEGPEPKKPLFQFTGDENFDDSDEDEDEAPEGEEEDDEEDDELLIAFEVLDLARVCYEKQLEQIGQQQQEGDDKGKDVAQESSAVRHIEERLAETHDALSEISLENEKYPQAIEDGRTSLKYKLKLYPEDSELVAEAHFKLSLALEFASVTTAAPGDGAAAGAGQQREDMDQGLRDEAVAQMELALKSSRLKLQNKEVELATMASPEDNELMRQAIAEMKEIIADMEQRHVDLKNDPIDTKGLLGGDASNPLGGLLGAQTGESAAQTQARVDEAKKTATDLSGLVRKKKPAAATEDGSAAAASNGKRKASGAQEGAEEAKKAKVDDEA